MTRIAVIDTETTGDTDTDQVIELAVVTLEDWTDRRGLDPSQLDNHNWHITQAWSTLVRPSVPVHPAARAAHHITDDELAAAPTLDVVRQQIVRQDWGEFVAAHNATFDWRLFTQTFGAVPAQPDKTIDTYRVARHLWPDAPTYSNGGLRYWLPGLDEEARRASLEQRQQPGVLRPVPGPLDLPPHRALPDAWVTTHVLLRMLRSRSAEDLCTLTQAPVLLPTFPIGPHRGKPLDQVPIDTLKWVLTLPDIDADLRHTCQHELARADRPPVLLETCHLRAFRGKPWAEVRSDYLLWVLRSDFDADVHHTARTVLASRQTPTPLDPRGDGSYRGPDGAA